jgi:predicted DNA-binding transcriptional regulator AlpA
MTLRELERRTEQRKQSLSSDIDQSYRVLSFRQWCELNGFSAATGRRILKAGTGPVIIQLSDRRIGITVGANADWQASRARIPSAE